jgi:hypothetical protein
MNYIPVNQVDATFPFALATLYGYHCRKKIAWLTRIGPDGNRGRILWIKVSEFNEWCQNRGYKYRLAVDQAARSSQISTPMQAEHA